MRENVSFEHLLIDLQFDSLHDNLPYAADEAVVRLPPGQPLDLRVSADEESVVRVRRRDAGNSDARLSEDVVYGERDHVLGFDG